MTHAAVIETYGRDGRRLGRGTIHFMDVSEEGKRREMVDRHILSRSCLDFEEGTRTVVARWHGASHNAYGEYGKHYCRTYLVTSRSISVVE